ncbi:GspE/PulE family protein [Patescibacteria group bacterium]|nr:GspE/PulE family protein [Patescibacteria group bacterium]MBU1876822.1 GspE/PulE family protein [Patescibacteria group bacterium]
MTEVSKKITGSVEISSEIIQEAKKEIQNISQFKEKISRFSAENITDVLDIILIGAINLSASDIHIEPSKNEALLRARIDGMLQDITSFDLIVFQKVLSRIKLLSGLKLNINDRPQDGRFSVSAQQDLIEIRSSTLPAEYGESIVLRILNPKNLITLEALGLREDLLKAINKELTKPDGMIIITGPTGSGKTTTLYSFLTKTKNPENKIITIEDPIEYHLSGISQTQTHPEKGYDFASGLKSIMRQDPDVILVGEIRDLETAQIAIQAALTGHLVLTTLHTNDAAGTIARLISLGAKSANIGPAINLAIAQRLIRKVCPQCFKMKTVSDQDLEKIKKGLKNLPEAIKKKLPSITKSLQIPQSIGCHDCNSTGFRGRIGIFEAFFVNDKMEKFISTSNSIALLKEEAIKQGMITLRQDGLIKVLEKITTIEEIDRVMGEE